ncbi:SrfA family protein [Pseudomonas putida]|uniref:SrfA family protein n=1 Tax=Pseudomonas putida TaxID=303 RepID=UPI00301DBDDB
MRGVLLRSGKSEDFTALGETGQPVYRAALQIREAIRRKHPSHPDLVEHLAIPQTDELGSTIDWYSDRPGDVIPWSSATEEERAPARAQLEILQARINDLSNELLGVDAQGQPLSGAKAGAQGDRTVFGKLLTCVVPFPDENFVYLVDGRPVLTFWGFIHAGAERGRQPLHCLYPRTPKTAEPLVPPPPIEPPPLAPAAPVPPLAVPPARPSWWRRWWWLPLLLLLLLLLLLGLRSCGVPALGIPPLNVPGLPHLNAGQPLDPVYTTAGTSGGIVPSSGAGAGVAGVPVAPGSADAGQAPAIMPPASNAETPAAAAPASAPEASQAAPSEPAASNIMAPAPPGLPEETPPAAAQPNLLSIPPDAGNGTADFLNGDWAGAGIQEVGTGKPLRLKYDFQNGKGQATVSRSDGVRCDAPVEAAMNGGLLSINSSGQATCADGSSYDLPQVNCKPGAQGVADCSGNYGSQAFPMLMKQAGQ